MKADKPNANSVNGISETKVVNGISEVSSIDKKKIVPFTLGVFNIASVR